MSTISTTVTVSGMTCGHCVAAVTEELMAVPAVTGVEIDLVAGGDSPVRIASDMEIDSDAIRAAVDEAGYGLA